MSQDPPARDPGDRHICAAARIIRFIDEQLSAFESPTEQELVMSWVRECQRLRDERMKLAVDAAVEALRLKHDL